MDWTTEDRDKLRTYLFNTKGRLVEYLRTQLLKSDAKTIEETALQAKERKGGEELIEKLEQASEKQLERIDPAPSIDVTGGLPR